MKSCNSREELEGVILEVRNGLVLVFKLSSNCSVGYSI